MDIRTDSKYYMYVNDEQFGPFSHQMIVEELQYERLGKDVFLWAEGMSDWKPLQEVDSFASHSHYLPEVSKISSELRNYSWDNTQKELDEEFEQKRMDEFESFSIRRPSEASAAIVADLESLTKPQSPDTPKKKVRIKHVVWGVFAIAITGVGVMGAAYWQEQRFYNSIVSHLEGTTFELARMRDTLNGKKTAWAPVSILKERGDNKEPSLFVAGNLPDGSRLNITLEGVAGTLVGALQQGTTVETVLKDRMAYTKSLKKENGSLVPGYYSMRVECLTCTEAHTRRMELRNTIAIGIKDKAIYERDLGDFHKLVRKQAESELMEVEEVLRLVDERMLAAVQFPVAPPKEAIQQQLQETLYAINEDVARTSYIYGIFYLQLKSIYHLIEQKDLARAQVDIESLRSLLKRNRDAFQASQGYPVVVE